MFCVNCGTKLREHALFCVNCGTKVDEALREQEAQILADKEAAIPAEAAPAADIPVDTVTVETKVAPIEITPVATEPEVSPAQSDSTEISQEQPSVEPETAPVIRETAVHTAPTEPKPVPVTFDFPVTAPTAAPAAPVVPVMPTAPAAAPAKQPKPVKQSKPPKQPQTRRKPHIAVRIPLQLLSFVLSVVLVAAVLATVAVADVNHLLSADGMKQVINGILIPTAAPQRVTPVVGAAGVSLDNTASADIPKDLLSGDSPEENTENLVNWIYQKIEEANGQPLKFDEEQLMTFVQESTAADFLAEKLAAYAQDFVSGTEEASISIDEIMELLEENEELLEETFDVQLSAKQKRNIESNIQKVMEQNDVDHILREQVFASVEKTIEASMSGSGMGWKEVQKIVKLVCSDTVLYMAVGACALLVLLLCLLNFYNVPAGLTWSAVPTILIGLVLNAPLWLVAVDFDALREFLPTVVGTALSSLVSALLPIHSIVLYAGLGLLVISIFWRAIRAAASKGDRAYQA